MERARDVLALLTMGSEGDDRDEPEPDEEPIQESRFFGALSPEGRAALVGRLVKSQEEIEQVERHRAEAEADAQRRRCERLRREIRESCGMVGDMWGCRFDNFELSKRFPGQIAALKKSKKCRDLLPGPVLGLALHGETGRGKSHLVKATISGAIGKPEPVQSIYVNCSTLEETLKRERLTRQGPTLAERILGCQFVGLDDVDKGLAGDAASWVRAWLKGLIDAIDAAGAPVVILSSRFSPEEHREALDRYEQLWSRLMKLCHWQEVDGENYRLKQAKEADPYWV